MERKNKPLIMGILNCTPDSFYDGKEASNAYFIEKGLSLAKEGAHILDIGGESSRPGAETISLEEECSRVIPVITELKRQCNCIISIDTRKADVAQKAIDVGADWVNDISAGEDPAMFTVVIKHAVKYIAMHMQGSPKMMQLNPQYSDVTGEIIAYLKDKTELLISKGLSPQNVIWDPGIGFGKTLAHNVDILKHLDHFTNYEQTVLIGISRKSFISGISPASTGPQDRLGGSLAPLAHAYQCGVEIFRVHDVQATCQFFDVLTSIVEA